MINQDIMNKFGYSEMYEWSELFKFDINPFGRFVTFSKEQPGKIVLANDNDKGLILGVTTINSVMTSDDPNEWQGKYLANEYGDHMFKYVNKANAQLSYDERLEMPLITTYKTKDIKPVINPDFDSTLKYEKRSDRKEWIRVHLLGKCIVTDNGECEPGKYCTIGENGIAIPFIMPKAIFKYYVIDRLSENTIMIFFK